MTRLNSDTLTALVWGDGLCVRSFGSGALGSSIEVEEEVSDMFVASCCADACGDMPKMLTKLNVITGTTAGIFTFASKTQSPR